MSKLSTDPYKGVRDFYPEDKFIQNHIDKVWREVAERFGYEEYDASILEPSEIYREKSGDEIVNQQTYTFTDRGGREVTIRPEMTPTVARMVAARRRELGYPLRWYSIPNLFRYEATQRGRLREHWQLNVDIFAIDNVNAEIEVILLADRIMKEFGANPEFYEIRINTNGTQENLDTVLKALQASGLDNVKVDETLKRGQAYYTGVVFEFFDTDPANPRAILGGGRYDNLTELFGDSAELPAVGFGAGDVTIKDFLETHGLLPSYIPATKLWIIPTDLALSAEIGRVLSEIRMQGVNAAVDWSGKKVGEAIKTADKLKIPYIVVVGEDELRTETYKVKNLETGEEISSTLSDISECVK